MKLIAEKINGTRARVARAIAERDAGFIHTLAIRQSEAGADWLDVNAGTHPDREPEDLVWLVNTVQDVSQLPLALDSTNPKALSAAVDATRQTPLINSISGEPYRLTGVLPIVVANGCPTIVLCMDGNGIPAGKEGRLDVLRHILEHTQAAGIPDDRVYVDPLIMTIATDTSCGTTAVESMQAIRAEFPKAHLTVGLSNISFGLPARSLVNRTFLVLAMAAGLDSAIADPLDPELRATILAAEMLLGRDRHCLGYIRAHRAGLLERQPSRAA